MRRECNLPSALILGRATRRSREEYVLPLLMMITVSTQPYEFHQRNADALGRVLARLGR
jgi:hypothetical protein